MTFPNGSQTQFYNLYRTHHMLVPKLICMHVKIFGGFQKIKQTANNPVHIHMDIDNDSSDNDSNGNDSLNGCQYQRTRLMCLLFSHWQPLVPCERILLILSLWMNCLLLISVMLAGNSVPFIMNNIIIKNQNYILYLQIEVS